MQDNRQRQATELLLLTTMYPSELTWHTTPAPNLEQPTTLTTDPSFALTIHRKHF
jgi:hypothetical protein